VKIYLANNTMVAAVARGDASAESRASVGPGPVLSIMRFPRADLGEAGEGRVLALPPPRRLAMPAIAAKKGSQRPHTAHCQARLKYGDGECECGADELHAAWRVYEAELYKIWTPRLSALAPGVLGYGSQSDVATPETSAWDGSFWMRGGLVVDGATLICACSRGAATAGRCHRVIAADLLRQAGWDVVLDGRPQP
jgi:hypothetical protein